MTIRVLNYIYDDKRELTIEADAPLRVRDILNRASIPLDLFGMAIAGGKVLLLDDLVPPGSEVRLIPPVGGG